MRNFVVLHVGALHDLPRHTDLQEALEAAGEAAARDRTPRTVVALSALVSVSPRPQVDVEWLDPALAKGEGGAP